MIVALSHFGTFANLQVTHSALNDGDIPTWSFYGATYSSPYFYFEPVEAETNTRTPLQAPSQAQIQVWSAYFRGSEAFPFIDFNQKFVLSTEQFPDTLLQGHSFADILHSLGQNQTAIGEAIDASAAEFTKYLCVMDGNQPAATCAAVRDLPAMVAPQPSYSAP